MQYVCCLLFIRKKKENVKKIYVNFVLYSQHCRFDFEIKKSSSSRSSYLGEIRE